MPLTPKAFDTLLLLVKNSRAFLMAWVKANPVFGGLRTEPLYRAILQKMEHPRTLNNASVVCPRDEQPRN